MAKNQPLITWSDEALQNLCDHYSYIHESSPQNAESVLADILEQLTGLPEHPERYPKDKFKLVDPDGEFRAFEIHHLRFTYKVSSREIRILRIRHVRQRPVSY